MPGRHWSAANRGNDYHLDRAAQRRGDNFTGIPSFAMQDTAVQESQGRVADRTLEHLVSSDDGVIVTRRLLLDAARVNQAGKPIPGLDPQTQAVRAGSLIVPLAGLQRVDRAPLQPLAREQRDWVAWAV